MTYKKQKIIGLILAVVILLALGYFSFVKGGRTDKAGSITDVLQKDSKQELQGALGQTYSREDYKFSFQYPDDFEVGSLQDEKGEVIVAKKNDGEIIFQIFIIPFDELTISIDRIKRDLPDMKIKNVKEATLTDGSKVIVFLIEEAGIGDTREVWFVRNGYLFEITALVKNDALVGKIMETWKFN